MRHISYAEAHFATDEQVADLVLDYATVLARQGSADTVTVPGRIGAGGIEPVSILVGPASQITAWSDDEPFGQDVSATVADLQRRIHAATADIVPSVEQDSSGGIDAFDDLA